jgi:hypothetical protein
VGFLPLFGGPGYEQSLATGLVVPVTAAIATAISTARGDAPSPLAELGRGVLAGLANLRRCGAAGRNRPAGAGGRRPVLTGCIPPGQGIVVEVPIRGLYPLHETAPDYPNHNRSRSFSELPTRLTFAAARRSMIKDQPRSHRMARIRYDGEN